MAATTRSREIVSGPALVARVSVASLIEVRMPSASVSSGRPARVPTTRRTTTRCPTSCVPSTVDHPRERILVWKAPRAIAARYVGRDDQ